MSTALVVGAGPNGLAAAVALAESGVEVTVLEGAEEIGGGARSSEAIVPGLLHDHCSAFHPMAVGSRFLNRLGLDRYGLQWRWPEIDCAHPLDDGDAGVLRRSIDETVAGLGADGSRWRGIRRAVGEVRRPLADIMGPLLRVPEHPPGGVRAAGDAEPVPDWNSGHVHLLRRHPARTGSAWNVLRECCRGGPRVHQTSVLSIANLRRASSRVSSLLQNVNRTR